MAGADLRSAEESLREFGAEFSDATPPDQVMVWRSSQVRGAEQNLADRAWLDGVVHFGSCLSDTGPGDRGAVYETGGSGIVGFYDFSGYAGRREGQAFPFMAAGVYRPLPEPTGLDRLRADPTLGHWCVSGSLHPRGDVASAGWRGRRTLGRSWSSGSASRPRRRAATSCSRRGGRRGSSARAAVAAARAVRRAGICGCARRAGSRRP